jgi:hypothetical protein
MFSCALTFVHITSTATRTAATGRPLDLTAIVPALLEVGPRRAGLHSTGFFVTTLKSLQKIRVRANFLPYVFCRELLPESTQRAIAVAEAELANTVLMGGVTPAILVQLLLASRNVLLTS